jgi:hypothetical protein
MKIFNKIIFCSFSILISYSSLQAQDSLKVESFKFGFGAAVFERLEFYFPINISDQFRIEPILELRITNAKSEQSNNDGISLEFSIGIFPIVKYDKLNIYYGARIGYIYTDKKSDYDEDRTKGLIISPTIGGEYFLISRFSLSTELHYEYKYYNYRYKYYDELENNYISSGNTRANIILRVYLY